ESNCPELFDILVDQLSPTDLQSLLLAVYEQRALRSTPASVLLQYTENRFVQPTPADPRRLAGWDSLAFSLLPAGFEALALAPVCPLGTNSAVATVSQNKVLTTA